MAIDRPHPAIGLAVQSLMAQFLRGDELIVVLNGTDSCPSDAVVATVAQANRTMCLRLIEAHGLNLAAALNVGIREARSALVARADADDLSLLGRLEAQVAFMNDHPEIVVLGTAFERIDSLGRVLGTCVQPCDPREVRWRLLIQNCVAHGSVMMRKDAVLAAGGYDESCERAQDYELWLRLASGGPVIANLPGVLYRYRSDVASKVLGEWVSSPVQGEVGARALSRAWDGLPSLNPDVKLEAMIARVIAGDPAGGAAIEQLLTEAGPTRERLRAHLWAKSLRGHTPTAALEAGRGALLRETGAVLRSRGVRRLWLWGAGTHTGWLLGNIDELGVAVVGIVDDRVHGQHRHGFDVCHPSELDDTCDVLLSSDVHEDSMWASSVSARARGVRVHRLYGVTRGVCGAVGEAA